LISKVLLCNRECHSCCP